MAVELPYPSLVFAPLDKLTAEEMNQIVANYTALANVFPIDGSNIASNAITTTKLANSAVTTAKIASSTISTTNIDWSTFLQKFATSSSPNSYMVIGSLLIMWGSDSITMNGTAANSFGFKEISYPRYFSNYSTGAILVTPSEIGGTNGLKVAGDLSNASTFKVTLGTSQAASSSVIKFSWLIIGKA